SGELAALEEVAQVAAGVAARAGRARAAVQDGLAALAPARGREVDAPAVLRVRHERVAVTAQPGRHGAVEVVDAGLDPADRGSAAASGGCARWSARCTRGRRGTACTRRRPARGPSPARPGPPCSSRGP